MANRIEGRENRMGGKKTRAAKAKLVLFSSTPINGTGARGFRSLLPFHVDVGVGG